MVTAREIMSQSLHHLERGTTVAQAACTMSEARVGSVIVTASGYPIGILTETDITRLVAQNADLNQTRIEDVMSSPLFSTEPDTDVVQIANTMSANHIKKMPVLEHQQVIGIITQTDIIKHVLAGFTELRSALKKGQISSNEFEERAGELFTTARASTADRKEWHMLCKSCGLRFLNEEHKGVLEHTICPRCAGQIEYDPTPPM